MKSIIKTFILILISNFSFADCGSGISVYPEGNINQKSVFLIEAYGWGKVFEIVKKLDTEYPIFLESDTHCVDLKVKNIFIGEIGLLQAVLQPEHKLIPNEKYVLRIQGQIDTMSVEQYFKKWNAELGKRILRKFVVSEKEDKVQPKLVGKPKLVSKRLIHFGCGPSINAKFKCNVEDDSEIIVLTELVDLKSKEKKKAFLKTRKGEFYVGRNMCSGFFNYNPDQNYKVRFKFYDASGNSTDKWTKWIKFSSPNNEKYNTIKRDWR